MMKTKLAFVATTALAGSLLLGSAAYAQSTGTNEVEAVVVTAARGQPSIDGVLTAESAPKAKASIDQEFISTQVTGQTIVQSLNLTPGLNFTNNDPYGSSGGNLRIRGFDGNRISLTFDGVPLNDTGNYAIYTNQQLDSELIDRASVNMGTTDVDSPTAAASGGTINYISRKPASEFGGRVVGAVGEFNYRRIFGLIDTGEIGPWGTTAYFAASYQKYDKFKGPGDLEKWQINGKIYQPFGDNGDFVSLAFHYNENRNNFYRTASMANFETYGRDFDNLSSCTLDAPTAGVADNDNNSAAMYDASLDNGRPAAENPAYTASCGNYYGLRINPSNTGNIREQAKWSISENLTLTVDSAFQYTLANGGGSQLLSEVVAAGAYGRVTGANVSAACAGGGAGFDLNGDGDCLDTNVRFYAPSNTNTRRYTMLSSLIWDFAPDQTLRLAYTYDKGNHRQTGEFSRISSSGNPSEVFSAKDGWAKPVYDATGYFFRTRDRHSYAILNQISAEYRGRFFEDRLFVTAGVRAPFFKRELNQHCLTTNNSSSVTCTSQPVFYNVDMDPVTAGLQASDTLVTLSTAASVPYATGSTKYIAPFSKEVKYDKVLPNVGVSYEFFDNNVVYLSYAEGLSAPRTDQLYTAGVAADGVLRLSDVQPETSKAWDLGYRYSTRRLIISTAVWKNDFSNRIVTSYDPDFGFSIDRNVGDVKLWGWDAQVGWSPSEAFTLYGSLSYTNSELQDDLLVGRALTANNGYAVGDELYLPTKGKSLVETPEWMAGVRAQWNVTEDFSVALQGKKVDSRFTTDVNDEQTPGYMVFDFDARYELPWINDKGAYIQLNVTNLFDEDYYSTISSSNAKNLIPGVVWSSSTLASTNGGISSGVGFVGIGAPRTIQLTFSGRF